MKLVESIMTRNPCYAAGRKITVKGLMLHSVGCPQPKASAFINSWNSPAHDSSCVHGFIDGNDGTVYQTLPWNHRGWHCGSGSKGSGNNTHIGVEMCEPACIRYTAGSNFTCSDMATAKAVAKRIYEAAVGLFAMLCKKYSLDPLADGVVISHKEGHSRGIASNHGDPEHLWAQLDMGYPFSGLVRCGRCGKNYIRSGAPAYRTWTCRTRRKEGLENCCADIIPEEELFRLTAEVIGGEVTEDAVRDKITAIRAGENRTLVFCLRNGKETVKQWKEHETAHVCTEEQKRLISLKNSGRKRTDEERRQQSERMKEYWKGREYPEERRRKQSEKMREYWNDQEASDAHRQTVSRLMKEMRAGEGGAGKEGQDG